LGSHVKEGDPARRSSKNGHDDVQQYLRRHTGTLRSFGFLYPGAQEHESLKDSLNHPLMLNAMTGKVTIPQKDRIPTGFAALTQTLPRVHNNLGNVYVAQKKFDLAGEGVSHCLTG